MNELTPRIMSLGSRVARWMFYLALAWALLAVYVSFGYGLADNGDYGRIMKPFASMPLGFDENWPEPGTAAYKARFWTFWYPDWKLGAEGGNLVRSSAWILWWPGVVLNRALFSDGVLHLSIVGLPLKALMLCMFFWAGRGLVRRYGLAGGLLALAIAWVFFDAASLGYLNTFYQESAQVVGSAVLAVALVWWVSRKPSLRWRSAIYPLGAGFLIATSKNASFHVVLWVALTLGVIEFRDGLSRRRAVCSALAHLLVGIVAAAGAFVLAHGTVDMVRDTKMHSFFSGVLLASKQPEDHLRNEGLPPAAERCIGESSYSAIGSACGWRYAERLGYGATARAVLREPMLFWRLAVAGADDLFVATPLGHKRMPPYSVMDLDHSALSSWSAFKQAYFPRGASAVALFCVAVIASVALWLRHQTFAMFGGLFALIALSELFVAIVGAGRIDLDKHLFFASLAVDYSLLFWVLSGIESFYRGSKSFSFGAVLSPQT